MPNTDEPKIGFLAAGFMDWAGGRDFLRLCIGAIDSVRPGVTWPVLASNDTFSQRALALAVAAKRSLFSPGAATPKTPPSVSRTRLRDALASIGCRIDIHSYYGSPSRLASTLRHLDIQVALPAMNTLGRQFPYDWVGYIFDLQHKRMPENFSRHECWQRDRTFRALLAEAPAVLVNSRSVVSDIEEFYPERRAALFALPFCPPANPALLEDIEEDELRAYGLPRKFFLISNQFWVHKSHQTAFQALRLVKDAGFDDAHIVCTGDQHDYRVPRFIEKLRNGIGRDGLTDRIHFLGVIPKRHQIAVMRRSIAVLQPTLFEGGPGGGALYDAVSTATPVILSDIPVNREADLGVIEFFRAGCAEALAQKMVIALQNPPQRLTADATLSMLQERQQQVGKSLLNLISTIHGASKSAPAGGASDREGQTPGVGQR